MFHRVFQTTVRMLLPCLGAMAVVIVLSQVAAACPTCSDSIAQSDPSQSAAARGYYWSILFMMSMPFTLFAALVAYFYWEIRKARVHCPAAPADTA